VNSENGMRLWVPADGAQAVILVLAPGSSKSDIETCLKQKNVVRGIDWAAIDDALSSLSRTNAPVTNIVIAKARPPVAAAWFCGTMMENGFAELMPGLVDFGNDLAGESGAKIKGRGAFVKRGEVIFKSEIISPGMNVLGGHIRMHPGGAPQYDPYAIHFRENENNIEYVALSDGYLCADKDSRITVRDPLVLSNDRMVLSLQIAEVKIGRKNLMDFIIQKWYDLHKEIAQETPLDRKMLDGLLDAGTVQCMVINRGRMPTPATAGRLEILIARDTKAAGEARPGQAGNKPSASEKIDPHERTPFHEVRKGEVIAELYLAKKGLAGVDALGTIIDVGEVDDLKFNAGKNVEKEANDDVVRYTSTIDGIAVLLPDGVDVMPEFRIQGDVGPETGNIRFSGAIVVEGSVLSGFIMRCGGDMTVRGCVENGAIIECGGDLTVDGGLIGEKTVCTVKKTVRVGYVQDCSIRASGSVIVKSYIFNSTVFSGEELSVDGQYVTGDERGAIVGGQVGAMKSLTVHSAGSPMAKTMLSCGVDLVAEKVLVKVNQAEPVLARHIALLQMQIGIDVRNPKATIQALAQRPFLREKMKDKVVELKRVISERDQLIRAVPELEKRTYAQDLSKIFIKVHHLCGPDILLRMGQATKLIYQKSERKNFRCIDGAIFSTDI
jgi:uncharacterized protein (DUF342 family)